MKHIIFAFIVFAFTVTFNIQAFAISRVVVCFDEQTNNPELQFVLRGGVATVNVCTGDVCSIHNMTYAQTLILQDNPAGKTLHYVYSSGKNLPVRETLDILFQGLDGDPVQITIDGTSIPFKCM